MFKIRFNLGRGINYKKWKIITPNNNILYYEPSQVSLHLENITLKNNKIASQAIFKGANKRVCAWIECEKLKVDLSLNIFNFNKFVEINYNPRIKPFWTRIDRDVDDIQLKYLVTSNNKVYECLK